MVTSVKLIWKASGPPTVTKNSEQERNSTEEGKSRLAVGSAIGQTQTLKKIPKDTRWLKIPALVEK